MRNALPWLEDSDGSIGRGAFAATVIFALLVACGSGETVSVEEAAARVRAHSIPAEQKLGRDLYTEACASCHGLYGEGSKQGPPMLHSFQAHMHADFAFERAVREGVQPHHYRLGAMPPIEGLGPEDVEAVVGYVRWMQEAAGLR